MTLEIVYNPAPLGHEIIGIDLRNIEDTGLAEIEAAFDKYGVIVFRDQSLSAEDHLAFSRRFGRLDIFPLDRFNLDEHPEILVLSNILEDGSPIGWNDGGRYWHSDMWNVDKPPRGSVLRALEVPHREGRPLGDTYFASTSHAYATLTDTVKNRIETLEGVFSTESYKKFVGHDKPRDIYVKETIKASDQTGELEIVHPLVRVHPQTGEKCLYVVEGTITRILGLSDDEARVLLDELLAHTIRHDRVYRHCWRVGDVVMWDNYSAIHRATGDFQLPLRRLMHRTTLSAPAAPV